MKARNDLSGEPKHSPGQRRYPGFISLIVVPRGHSMSGRNVRMWQETENSGDWFMEPLPAGEVESDWTRWSFEFDEPQAIYHRGRLVFVSVDGQERVERRDAPEAIVFGDGNERSMLDLGHYIAGWRDDGAVVKQTEIK